MAELGEGLRARMEELQRRFPDMPRQIAAIAVKATDGAIEKATELTPPDTFEGGEQRGQYMGSGEMAQHWQTDSSVSPVGSDFVTILANDKQYASYVNDGHRVDKHFVPGLYVDPTTGLLSRDLERDVGLMVGTKTTYVEGLHITEQAIDKYREVAEAELDKLTREMEQT